MAEDYRDQVAIIHAIPGVHTVFVTNEYTELLQQEIDKGRVLIGTYQDRAVLASSYFKRAEWRRLARVVLANILKKQRLLDFLTGCIERRIEDPHNNINRYCNVIGVGDKKPREWRVVFAMQRNDRGWVEYLLRNTHDTDRFIIADQTRMVSLY